MSHNVVTFDGGCFFKTAFNIAKLKSQLKENLEWLD